MVTEYNLGSEALLEVEAMYVETPCLVSDPPDQQAINQHAAYVDLFQLGDLTSFLDKCDFLLPHCEDARSKREDYFSFKSIAQGYFAIYQA